MVSCVRVITIWRCIGWLLIVWVKIIIQVRWGCIAIIPRVTWALLHPIHPLTHWHFSSFITWIFHTLIFFLPIMVYQSMLIFSLYLTLFVIRSFSLLNRWPILILQYQHWVCSCIDKWMYSGLIVSKMSL